MIKMCYDFDVIAPMASFIIIEFEKECKSLLSVFVCLRIFSAFLEVVLHCLCVDKNKHRSVDNHEYIWVKW